MTGPTNPADKPVTNDDGVDFAFRRGRRDYVRGLPCPKAAKKWDGVVRKPIHARWYGWMVERGMQIIRAQKAREMLGGGE